MKIIHESAKISSLADIEDSVRGSRVVIGERTMIDSFAKIKFAGGLGDVVIGEDSYINSGVVVYSGNGVSIGSRVLIAANCTLAAANHEYKDPERCIVDQGFMESRGGIVIEDDVWIGAGCVILDGAKIGKGAVIAAMSLVRGEIEPYGIYAGNPIQRIGFRK